jgi:hypothetical protein
LAALESLMPAVFWIFFLFLLMSPLLFAAALAGVAVGTTTSAVAHIASVKSLIADFLMRLSRL